MTLEFDRPGLVWAPGERFDLAPEEAGFYAWYAVPRAGTDDWKASGGPERDGEVHEAFRHFISVWAAWHADDGLRITAEQALLRQWTGELRPADRVIQSIGSEAGSPGTENLRRVMSNEALREAASQLIPALVPLLAPPLYIGISDRPLSVRLGEHVEALHSLGDRGSEENWTPRNFAERAAGRGLTPADVFFLAMPLSAVVHVPLNETDRSTLLKAVEYLANRNWTPPLGKE